MRGVFVTGTDTGVGKTLVSSALVRGYGRRGERVAGLKPIVSGVMPGGVWEDVEALRRASVPERAVSECTLYTFAPAIAPHFAAYEAGCAIDLHAAARFVRDAAAAVDRVVVEGAGGFLVPLTPTQTFADFASLLKLPVVLVVGLRLGAINHALLTYEAIVARGLTVAGWIGSHLAPTLAAGTVEGLHDYLAAPCLGLIPYQEEADADFALGHIELPS